MNSSALLAMVALCGITALRLCDHMSSRLRSRRWIEYLRYSINEGNPHTIPSPAAAAPQTPTGPRPRPAVSLIDTIGTGERSVRISAPPLFNERVVALSPGDAETAQTGGSGRVVVVDDDEVFSAVLGSALEGDGFEILTAADGPAAVELVRRWSPGAVILDLELADTDGLACLVRLRAMGPVGQLPVVVLTAHDGEEYRERGRKMGADRFLTKPVDMEMLIWHLDELLARSSHVRVNPLAGLRQQPTIPRGLV